jgi:hypothetical protein
LSLGGGISTLEHVIDVRYRQHLSAIKPNAESGFWVLGGAMLEDTPKEGSPLKITGSVMMAVASSKEEVMEKIKSDIYADKGVWDMDKVSDSRSGKVKSRGYELTCECRFKSSLSSRLLDLLCRRWMMD